MDPYYYYVHKTFRAKKNKNERAMRLITGDEIGLIKEIVPELCRRREDEDGRPLPPPPRGPSAPSLSAAFAPTSSLAAASRAVRRLDLPRPAIPPPSSSSDGGEESFADIPGRSRGVISLAFLSSPSSSRLDLAALRADGVVETWRGSRPRRGEEDDDGEGCVTPASYARTGIAKDSIVRRRGGGEESGTRGTSGWYMERPVRPIGMVSSHARQPRNCGIGNSILATCDSVGGIAIINADALSVVARYEAFLPSTSAAASGGGALPLPSSSRNDPRNAGTLTRTKGGRSNVDVATCLAMNAAGSTLAVGGRERGARLLDVETGAVVWKAKNLPPDPRTLLQKMMWTTSIAFLRSDDGGGAGDGAGVTSDTMACGTACGQVQIYDVRSSSTVRRPASYTPERMIEHRVTALCQLGGNVLAAGDAVGDVHLLDLRKLSTGRYLTAKKSRSGEETGLGRLAGPGGSVRQMAAHPTMPNVVACVGLDRKLWTWDLTAKNGKRKPLDCVYLKQRLNCVLFCDDGCYGGGTTGRKIAEEEGEGDDGGRGGGDEGRERDLEDDAVEDYVDSDDDDAGEDVVGASGSSGETESDDAGGSGGGSSADDDEEDDDSDGDAVVIASKRRRT